MDTMAEQYSPPESNNANMNFSSEGYSPPAADQASMDFALAVFNVLAGYSNIFTAIWADPNASRTNGKMYTLSWGDGVALSVLDMSTNVLYDQYTKTDGGRAEEVLTNDDTRDLNVDTP